MLRRCQILLASALRGTRPRNCPPAWLRRPDGTQHHPHDFNEGELAVLHEDSSPPTSGAHGLYGGRLPALARRCCTAAPATLAKRRTVDIGLSRPGQFRAGHHPNPVSDESVRRRPQTFGHATGSGPNTGSPAPIPNTSFKKCTRPLDCLGQPATKLGKLGLAMKSGGVGSLCLRRMPGRALRRSRTLD